MSVGGSYMIFRILAVATVLVFWFAVGCDRAPISAPRMQLNAHTKIRLPLVEGSTVTNTGPQTAEGDSEINASCRWACGADLEYAQSTAPYPPTSASPKM
jgi:hypothetical protein